MDSPKEEQAICVTCGFCCDGTLFNKAVLNPGEQGSLPAEMEAAYYKTEASEYFRQPCAYFDGKCNIYDQKKAHICSAFRCKLLKDLAKNKLTQTEALGIVQNAMTLRAEVGELFKAVSDALEMPPFREVLDKIGAWEESKTAIELQHPLFQLLKIKSVILEALLIKYFKSKETFDKMIETPTIEEN